MSGLYHRFKDWENARAGFSPGGLPPSPVTAPIDLSVSKPPAQTVASPPTNATGFYDQGNASPLIPASSGITKVASGSNPVPLGAVVRYQLSVAGDLAVPGSNVQIYLQRRSDGYNPAGISGPNALAHQFLMTLTDYLDTYTANSDTAVHSATATWQATTP